MASPAREARQRAQQELPGAIVEGRGAGWIMHRHPTNPRIHILDTGVGNIGWHIQGTETEVDTVWLPDSGVWQWQMTLADYQARSKALFNGAPLVEYRIGADWVTLQPRQLNWTNDRGDILVAGVPQAVTAAAADDRLTWASAYGFGRDFEWETQTARLAKKVILRSYDNLPIPTSQILTGGNPVLAPQFQFDYSNTLTVYVDGQPWTGGNRPTLETANPIEFRRGDGTVAFVFNTPHVFNDAEVEERAEGVVTRVSKSGNNLLVEVRVSQPWLATAVYPVTIDPTIDVSPNASNRDGNELATGNVQIINASFTVDGNGEWQAGKFIIPNPSSGLKAGATVTTSYITMNYTSGTLDEPDITIYGEDTTTPGDYAAGTGTFSISGRTKTSASVPWSNTNLGGPGDFNTPSLNSILQELVDTYDYSAGGVMAFQYTSTNGTTTRDCDTMMYDGSTTLCWRLHLVYTEGGLTVNLNAAALTAAGQTLGVTGGAVSTNLNAAALSAAGQAYSVVPGAKSTALNAAVLSATGQAYTVTGGPVSTSLLAAALSAVGGVISVSAGGGPQTVNLAAALCSALGQALTVSGGPVSVALNAALLAAQGQEIDNVIVGPVTTGLNAALLNAAGQVIAVVPGAVSLSLSAAALVASGQAYSVVVGGVSTALSAAGLVAQGQTIIIDAGGAAPQTVNLLAAALVASGQTFAVVPGAVSTELAAAAVTAIGQTYTVVPGAYTASLAAAVLTAQGQVITVSAPGAGEQVDLDAAVLSAVGQAYTVVPGARTVVLDAGIVFVSGGIIVITVGAPGGILFLVAWLTDSALVPGTVRTIALRAGQAEDSELYRVLLREELLRQGETGNYAGQNPA